MNDYSQAAETLARGQSVLLHARGFSMHPIIPDGTPVLVMPLAKARRLKVGDIVLARLFKALVLHRIVEEKAEGYVLKGDWNPAFDGVVPLTDILGLAQVAWRKGQRTPLDSFLPRTLGLAICRLMPRISKYEKLL